MFLHDVLGSARSALFRLRGRGRIGRRLIILAVAIAASPSATGIASADARTGSSRPDLGPNVVVFDPGMPVSQIQATVDAIATRQVDNEMGTQRYALLFKPGTYG